MRTTSIFTILFFSFVASSQGQQYTIKFATIAPEKTTWHIVMKEYDAAVRKESGGRVGFQIYAGGVLGDEKAVLRKIRVGQLHAGGFTGVAMGEIAPRVRILDTPFLFQNYAEVDHIYKTFEKEFEQAFMQGGFVLLGWAEVGFVHVFTNTQINKSDDLKRIKLWTWEGDPVAEMAFRALGINPIPVAFPDVLTSLQTGLIDAFYTPPYAAIQLQWHTRAKYMIETPISDAAGAVLLAKSYFDKLPSDLQEIILRNGKRHLSKITQLAREDNRRAIEQIRKAGISVQAVDSRELPVYTDAGRRARRMLVGRLYPEELLNNVEHAVEDFRKNSKTSQ